VSLVQAEGFFAEVFIKITAAYRAAYDQYVEGSFESTRRDAVISLSVRTILSAAPLSSGVYRGEV
jgi:hypothetical protein